MPDAITRLKGFSPTYAICARCGWDYTEFARLRWMSGPEPECPQCAVIADSRRFRALQGVKPND